MSSNIEKIQLEAARIVTGLPIYTRSDLLLRETGWEELKLRRQHRKLSLFYTIINGAAPSFLTDFLPAHIGNLTRFNLRNADHLRQPTYRLQSMYNSFFPSTTDLWNGLDDYKNCWFTESI